MRTIDSDVTDAVAHAVGRPIANSHRTVGIVDVLVTRSHLFQHELTKTEGQFPNGGIVRL